MFAARGARRVAARMQQAASAGRRPRRTAHSPWRQRDGWRLNATFSRSSVPRRAKRRRRPLASPMRRAAAARCGRRRRPRHGAARPERRAAGRARRPAALRRRSSWRARSAMCSSTGAAICSPRVDPLYQPGEGTGAEGRLVAPMPGKVIALARRAGAGREGRAAAHPRGHEDGAHDHARRRRRAQSFRYAVGEQVSEGAELVDFEPHAGAHGARPSRRRSELSDAASVVRPIARAER